MRKVLISVAATAALVASPAFAEAAPIPVAALKTIAEHACANPPTNLLRLTLPAGSARFMNARDHATLRAMCALYWQGRVDGDRTRVGLMPTNRPGE